MRHRYLPPGSEGARERRMRHRHLSPLPPSPRHRPRLSVLACMSPRRPCRAPPHRIAPHRTAPQPHPVSSVTPPGRPPMPRRPPRASERVARPCFDVSTPSARPVRRAAEQEPSRPCYCALTPCPYPYPPARRACRVTRRLGHASASPLSRPPPAMTNRRRAAIRHDPMQCNAIRCRRARGRVRLTPREESRHALDDGLYRTGPCPTILYRTTPCHAIPYRARRRKQAVQRCARQVTVRPVAGAPSRHKAGLSSSSHRRHRRGCATPQPGRPRQPGREVLYCTVRARAIAQSRWRRL